MMLSLYVTLGVFLLLATRNPSANRSLIAFAAWSNRHRNGWRRQSSIGENGFPKSTGHPQGLTGKRTRAGCQGRMMARMWSSSEEIDSTSKGSRGTKGQSSALAIDRFSLATLRRTIHTDDRQHFSGVGVETQR